MPSPTFTAQELTQLRSYLHHAIRGLQIHDESRTDRGHPPLYTAKINSHQALLEKLSKLPLTVQGAAPRVATPLDIDRIRLHPDLPQAAAGMSTQRVLQQAYLLLDEVPDDAMNQRWNDMRQVTVDDLRTFLEMP